MEISLLDGTTQVILMGILTYVFLIGIPQLLESFAKKKEKSESKAILYSNVLQYNN